MSKQERHAFLESLTDFTLYETFYEQGTMLGGTLSHWNETLSPEGTGKFHRYRKERFAMGATGTGRRRPTASDRSDSSSNGRAVARGWNMSLNIDEQEARLIWLNDIMPFVFRHAKTQEKPVTVFLGGQPAAGKTSGQDLAKRLHPGIIPIVGDDYRQYHPDYRRLLKEDPLRMPDETAGLAGRWTGMCVDNADEWGYPIIIEGTWRNVATVLDEARRCKALRRATHAIVVATPPLVSRAGIIDRFCSGLLAGNTARWTPLEAHDRTVRALRSNVPLIAGSGLIDRFTVTDRSGGIIADGTPSEVTAKAWMSRFDAPLTSDEQRDVGHAIDLARRCQTLMTPEDYERVMEIVNKLDAETFDLTVREYMESGRAHGRWVQNRNRDGSYAPGGHWRR